MKDRLNQFAGAARAGAGNVSRGVVKGARRGALLAGASLITAFASAGAAWSADPTPPPALSQPYEIPAEIEAATPEKSSRVFWFAALIASLGGLAALFGPKAVLRGAKTAARAGVKAASATAKVAVHVAKDPIGSAKTVVKAAKGAGRWGLLAAGVAVFGLLGVSVLDIEWLAGLVVGAAAVVTAGIAARRAQAALRPVPVKSDARADDARADDAHVN